MAELDLTGQLLTDKELSDKLDGLSQGVTCTVVSLMCNILEHLPNLREYSLTVWKD